MTCRTVATCQGRHCAVVSSFLYFSRFVGGALNSLAGGGTLVTFPALLFAGLNPIDANASSVVALFPGTFTAAWAYRRSILAITEFNVKAVLVLSNSAPPQMVQRAKLGPRGALIGLFVIAIYGDYFGGEIGFLMLAAFTLFGMRDIKAMNGLVYL